MVTQRDISETVHGLRQEAREPVVVVKVSGLVTTAEYLEAVASELGTLIDDETPIRVPED
jgi:hypothetical protein